MLSPFVLVVWDTVLDIAVKDPMTTTMLDAQEMYMDKIQPGDSKRPGLSKVAS